MTRKGSRLLARVDSTLRKREAEDYSIGGMTVLAMHDSVTTKFGNSYEYASVVEYFPCRPGGGLVDPVSTKAMRERDVGTSTGLRQDAVSIGVD